MARSGRRLGRIKKRIKATSREFTTALFILRVKQAGLTLQELGTMSFGFVMDILTEASNDGYQYPTKDQETIDAFF